MTRKANRYFGGTSLRSVSGARSPFPLLVALTVAFCFHSPPCPAEPATWRLFGGSFSTSWRSSVFHGHTEDCRTRICEKSDFENGNLDGSIGWRAGAERPVWKRARLEVLAGAELGVIHTEYNLSQRDVTMGELFAAGGLRLDVRSARFDLRAGAGAAAIDDGTRGGFASFVEIAGELPIGRSTALRVGARRANHGGPRSDDFSVLLVSGGTGATGPSLWDFTWTLGVSEPGSAVGASRELTAAPFTRLSAHRRLGNDVRLGLSYVATAHESARRTDLYFGIPGNRRGTTIQGFALALDRERTAWRNVRWRYGAGVESSSWEDEHGLLLSRRGEPLRAGVEFAASGAIDVILPVRRGMRFVVGAEQLYWLGIRMGELRVRSGVELSR
jgi:hypothetical protein